MTTALIDALKRELAGYEAQGRTERDAQVSSVLSSLGANVDEPRMAAPVEIATEKKPRERRGGR
jgi:hypothetical protein